MEKRKINTENIWKKVLHHCVHTNVTIFPFGVSYSASRIVSIKYLPFTVSILFERRNKQIHETEANFYYYLILFSALGIMEIVFCFFFVFHCCLRISVLRYVDQEVQLMIAFMII